MNEKIKNPKMTPWYLTAKGAVIVSGVFSILAVGMLLWNYVIDKAGLPDKEQIYSSELVEKKALLAQDPLNEELKKEIRNLDLELRQGYFQRKAFADRGRYFLLIGIVIFLFAIRQVAAIHKAPFKKWSRLKEPEFEINKKAQARSAISVMGLILLGGAVTLALLPTVDLTTLSSEMANAEEPTLPDYPAMEEIQQNWPRFRGPGGLGISYHERAPTSWNGETGEGILWKTEVPRTGPNSPIVWNDRLFFTGGDQMNKEVFCFSTATGDLVWSRRVENVPGNPGKELNVLEDTGFVAPTMACDGSRVYALFADGDLACFDFNGKQVWAKNLGTPDNIYGLASSLAAYQNNVLIQYDQGTEEDTKSKLIALEGKTGVIAWQATRPVANAWTTPVLAQTDSGEQIITCSEPWVIGYEPNEGKELWRANLMGTDLAPSPIYAQGLAIVVQPSEAMFAIRTDSQGDVTDTPQVAWIKDCPAPDICSPVSNGELIFLLGSMGELGCYETKTGEMIWEEIIDDSFQASPTIAGGWLYLLSEEGVTYRVKAAREYEAAGTSPLDEWLRASPAFMDGRIYIRGDRFLYCIGSE